MIIHNLPEEDYHSNAALSKTALWTLYNKTPYHFFHRAKKETGAMKFGKAAHTAILEPSQFEERFVKGPDDRRGNKWKDAMEAAGEKTLLTASEYDDALFMRDVLMKDATLYKLLNGKSLVEQSAFWNDGGVDMRCRPDFVRPDLKLMIDLKSTTDASPYSFAKRVAEFGYHMQEAVYTHGWKEAGGCQIEQFLFLTVEKEPPFAYAIYELEPQAVQEGWLAYQSALDKYRECVKNNYWPSYNEGVVSLDLPKYAYTLSKQEGYL